MNLDDPIVTEFQSLLAHLLGFAVEKQIPSHIVHFIFSVHALQQLNHSIKLSKEAQDERNWL